MSVKEDRMRAKVIEELGRREYLSTEDAVNLLQVSESTVRRLFNRMEASDDVIRVFGGVKANLNTNYYRFEKTFRKNTEQKRQIGHYAANLVSDGDCIFIDCGTTTVHMVEKLVEKIKRGELKDITVATNSMANFQLLESHCTTILVGGWYNSERKSFAGYLSERFVSLLHFDKSFLGADGFTFDKGFATSNPDFARLTGSVVGISDDSFVLMDSSKIGKNPFVVYDHNEHIRKIITDSSITEEEKLQFEAMQIQIFIA